MARARRTAVRAASRLVLLAAGAALVPAAPAAAAGPVGDHQRVSFTLNDANPNTFGAEPAIAENPRTRQHLVVWTRSGAAASGVFGRLIDAQGVPLGPEFPIDELGHKASTPAVDYDPHRNEFMVAFTRQVDATGEREVYVHRVSAAGAALGGDVRVSETGTGGDATREVLDPAIAFDTVRGEHLVVWAGEDLAAAEFEIHGQRIAGDGTPVGPDDVRLSTMGPDGDPSFTADVPDVAYDERHDEYLVAWTGSDDAPPHVAGEREVYVQRVTADGAEAGVDDRRVTEMGTPGLTDFSAGAPAVAYQPVTDEFLVAWSGSDDAPPTASEFEIFAQRLAWDGAEVGADDARISSTGPYVDVALTDAPDVAADFRAGEYLVTWHGADATIPLGKVEVFAQRLSAAGAEIGGDTRVSSMPEETSTGGVARDPAVAYDSQGGQLLIAWRANVTGTPINPGKDEVYAQRFTGGTAAAVASIQCKGLPPAAAATPGDPSEVVLTTGQMLINQRISQAAVRRANGAEEWFAHGLEARDLCQASLGATDLTAGSVLGFTGVPQGYGAPDPRPVVVAPAKPGDPSQVTLSVGQMLINQRISQAAVRRLNGLKARLDAGLTGGDVRDAQVGRAQLLAGVAVLFTPPVASPVAASVTQVAAATPGDPSKVTLSAQQMLINQRISQAAVRRANDLLRRLDDGIAAAEIRDGTLSAADLVPGLALSTTP